MPNEKRQQPVAATLRGKPAANSVRDILQAFAARIDADPADRLCQ